MTKSFFIDTSRCTACRGCQIACKEWHELPANKTKQRGSHQNPPDLNPYNYKLVRFSENFENGVVNWYFFPDQCRHCLEPPCKVAAESAGSKAITQDEATGAVLFNPKVKVKAADFKEIRAACPYDIPRYDERIGVMAKCTMCIDRVKEGMLPACVKTCPTGAMNFGDRSAMLELANKRLAEVKKRYKDAILANPDDVRVIFLLVDDPKNYHKFAVAQRSGGGLNRKHFLARIFAPFRKPVQRTIQA
jgi:formate dehydrogenase iron-sulfur subunit